MAFLRVVGPVGVLLILAWAVIFYGLTPWYAFALIAVIYAFWVLTPPYPDAELLFLPIYIGLIAYLFTKTQVKASKKKITLISTILAFVLTYGVAILILFFAITMFGITEFAGFNIDIFNWAGVAA